MDATFTDRRHLHLTEASVAKVAAQPGHDPPRQAWALAALSHLAVGFGTEDIHAVREEMTDKSEWTQ